jgi:hypothetical protein
MMADFRIVIDVRDVGGGDIDQLAESIMDEHGFNFDAAKGDFKITIQQKEGDSYYAREPGDDVIGA